MSKQGNFKYLRVIQTKTLTKTFSMNFCFEKQKRLTKRFDHFFCLQTKHSNTNNQKKAFSCGFLFCGLGVNQLSRSIGKVLIYFAASEHHEWTSYLPQNIIFQINSETALVLEDDATHEKGGSCGPLTACCFSGRLWKKLH